MINIYRVLIIWIFFFQKFRLVSMYVSMHYTRQPNKMQVGIFIQQIQDISIIYYIYVARCKIRYEYYNILQVIKTNHIFRTSMDYDTYVSDGIYRSISNIYTYIYAHNNMTLRIVYIRLYSDRGIQSSAVWGRRCICILILPICTQIDNNNIIVCRRYYPRLIPRPCAQPAAPAPAATCIIFSNSIRFVLRIILLSQTETFTYSGHYILLCYIGVVYIMYAIVIFQLILYYNSQPRTWLGRYILYRVHINRNNYNSEQ